MKTTHSINQGDTLTLHFGPLKYRLEAHDDWGRGVLHAISGHLACVEADRSYDRVIHLRRWINLDQFTEAPLPEPLAELLPHGESNQAWYCTDNLVNTVWSFPGSRQAFWTRGASVHLGKLRFHLPWNLIIADCIARGGGLVHAGLASHTGNGILFLAPPGGGKTTTLKTAPSAWTVLSDDAALLWPDDDGGWLASPLPAWGNLTSPTEEWLYPQIRTGDHCRIKSLLCLEKGLCVRLCKVVPAGMALVLYRALCEFPVTIMAEAAQPEALFRTAAQAARELSCWELSLPLNGDIWRLLSEDAA